MSFHDIRDIKLQEPKHQSNPNVHEPKSVWFNDKLVEASRFGEMEFLEVCREVAGCSRKQLLLLGNAYKDMKLIFGYGGTQTRMTGEEYHHHPKAVALIDMLELGATDVCQIIADLHHDSPEENAIFYGNTNHPRRSATSIHISTFDSLCARYGKRSAKMIDAVTKPPYPKPKKEMTQGEVYEYLQGALLKVVTAYPEVARECARVKTADRIQNLRTEPKTAKQMVGETETHGARLERRLVETCKLIRPIAGLAGENYRDLLETEIKELSQVLTPSQKSTLNEDRLIVAACKEASRSQLVRVVGKLIEPVQKLWKPTSQAI